MYTSHGHQIKGTIAEAEFPVSVARCGGPGMCMQCSKEAADAVLETKPNMLMCEEDTSTATIMINGVEVHNQQIINNDLNKLLREGRLMIGIAKVEMDTTRFVDYNARSVEITAVLTYENPPPATLTMKEQMESMVYGKEEDSDEQATNDE